MNAAVAPLTVDFYFDFSCPYAYLASTQLAELRSDTGASVTLKPFLLGGVFAHLGQPQNMSTALNAPKQLHNRLDLIRWADVFGVPLRRPFAHPNRTVLALRALLASPIERWTDVVERLFALYWQHGIDISSPDQVARALTEIGLDGGAIVVAAGTPDIKRALRERTNEAIAAGVFGAPAWVVGDQLFWGQDRIAMEKRAIGGWRPTPAALAFDFNQTSNAPLTDEHAESTQEPTDDTHR